MALACLRLRTGTAQGVVTAPRREAGACSPGCSPCAVWYEAVRRPVRVGGRRRLLGLGAGLGLGLGVGVGLGFGIG